MNISIVGVLFEEKKENKEGRNSFRNEYLYRERQHISI